MNEIAIFGAGGFGKEVLSLIKAINNFKPTYNIIGFFDDRVPVGTMINDCVVLGGIDALVEWKSPVKIVIAIGSPSVKKKIVNRISENRNIEFPTLIHPTVWIGDCEYVSIGEGCVICAGNMITTNITIGKHVILNLCCTIGHDSIIGDFSSFMPSVNISGEVFIGKEVYVGTGAKIINQLSIGDNTIIGAGSVVTKSLPSYCTAVGVPSKVIKQV